jgi:hypothetical protein
MTDALIWLACAAVILAACFAVTKALAVRARRRGDDTARG